MDNKLLNAMREESNITATENGGVTYRSTMDGVQDLFALGGAYRSRSDTDCVFLFKKAFEEDPTYALKCLFYLRDVRGGQGERRFFRVVTHWLADFHAEEMRRNLQYVSEFGRWDDLYAFAGTTLEKDAFDIIKNQLALDVSCKTPSLLAKWLKSENTSSLESRRLGTLTRQYLEMTPRQYRKTLSILRERIRVVERLMSQNRWDEIEFDKIPSRAGILYRNAFAKRDITKARYEQFAKSETTKVNAAALYPADVVRAAFDETYNDPTDPTRLMIQKYWDNLTDFFKGATFDGVAVVDTSGSMTMGSGKIKPIDVAIALGMYCGEKCGPKSPWYGHYITFSRKARLVPIEGVDFVDKVARIKRANLCENTNIKSVFDLLLRTAIQNNVAPDEMPKNVVIISDMEFDSCAQPDYWSKIADEIWPTWTRSNANSEMEKIMAEWAKFGYSAPHLVFWNVDARQGNIPMRDNGNVTFVSGYSPVLFEALLTGKSGWDLIKSKLDSDRYACIG